MAGRSGGRAGFADLRYMAREFVLEITPMQATPGARRGIPGPVRSLPRVNELGRRAGRAYILAMAILDLYPDDAALREQLAVIACEAGAINAPLWLPTLDDAREEVDDATATGQVARVLFDDAGVPIG